MIKNDTNNFFNDQETQDPIIREKLLFKDIGHFIIGESIKIGISKVIRNFKKIIK